MSDQSDLPPGRFCDRALSSEQALAVRVKAVDAAWRAQDGPLLREELRELGREATMLSKSVPLGGLPRRMEIAIEAGDVGAGDVGRRHVQ